MIALLALNITILLCLCAIFTDIRGDDFTEAFVLFTIAICGVSILVNIALIGVTFYAS